MSRVRVIALSVVIAVSLAGCVAGNPEPAPSETVAEPSSTPSAEPTKPALSDLQISAVGLGPLLLGAAPPVTSPELDPLVFDEDFCAEYLEPPYDFDIDPGLWVANYPDEEGFFGNPLSPFGVLVSDGTVRRIEVHASTISTEEGIHIGSTQDELLAAYPDGFAVSQDDDVSDVFALQGPSGWLVFEVTNDNLAGYWDAGKEDLVWRIAALVPELEPRAIAGSDNSVGNCAVV